MPHPTSPRLAPTQVLSPKLYRINPARDPGLSLGAKSKGQPAEPAVSLACPARSCPVLSLYEGEATAAHNIKLRIS